MIRAIATIVAAIQFAQPKVDTDEATRFAKALQHQAKIHNFDPLSGVSIIFHESSFRPDVVSRNGEDYGLAQIRARFIGACKKDRDPLRAPSKACLKVKRRLLTPDENIRVMAELITRNRKFCRKKTGSALFHQWLASYQGRNYARKKQWCKAGKGTWKVIKYRRKLIRELKRKGLIR